MDVISPRDALRQFFRRDVCHHLKMLQLQLETDMDFLHRFMMPGFVFIAHATHFLSAEMNPALIGR